MPKKAQIELSANLKEQVRNVWQNIAGDYEPGSNADAVETCLDADRMTTMGGAQGKAADDEVTKLIAAHGYPAVLRRMTAEFRFV